MGAYPQVCRWLELGLVVDWRGFPGFREAFDTGELAWDIDPVPFRRRAVEIYKGQCETENRTVVEGTASCVVHKLPHGCCTVLADACARYLSKILMTVAVAEDCALLGL